MAKSKNFQRMTYRVDKSGKRKTTVARQDVVSEKLADCSTPEQVVELAGDRVLMGIFANETGDPTHDPLGKIVADWLILQL